MNPQQEQWIHDLYFWYSLYGISALTSAIPSFTADTMDCYIQSVDFYNTILEIKEYSPNRFTDIPEPPILSI